MRALVLTNLYPPNAMGGYELSCRDVVDRWRAAGHVVEVLTTAESLTGVVEPPEVTPHVHRELSWYWRDHAFLTPTRREVVARERANHAVLAQALDRVRPDVVSAWHLGGMSLSLLTAVEARGLPLVANVCDEWPVYGPKVDPWSKRWSRTGRVVRRWAGVPTRRPALDGPASFVSAYTLAEVRRRSRWSFPGAEVVGSGVDLTDFPLAAAAVKPWNGRLLAVGRVERRKGFDVAVRALAELPGVALDVVGVADPSYQEELVGLVRALEVDDRVTFAAEPRQALRSRYAAADAVLFLPRWEEPFGLVPLEAMTQGTPVVATRRGGSAEFLVDEGNCLEVPVDDPAAVAAAVRWLAADTELRERLATQGLTTAARYTADALAERLLALHLRAIEVSRP